MFRFLEVYFEELGPVGKIVIFFFLLPFFYYGANILLTLLLWCYSSFNPFSERLDFYDWMVNTEIPSATIGAFFTFLLGVAALKIAKDATEVSRNSLMIMLWEQRRENWKMVEAELLNTTEIFSPIVNDRQVSIVEIRSNLNDHIYKFLTNDISDKEKVIISIIIFKNYLPRSKGIDNIKDKHFESFLESMHYNEALEKVFECICKYVGLDIKNIKYGIFGFYGGCYNGHDEVINSLVESMYGEYLLDFDENFDTNSYKDLFKSIYDWFNCLRFVMKNLDKSQLIYSNIFRSYQDTDITKLPKFQNISNVNEDFVLTWLETKKEDILEICRRLPFRFSGNAKINPYIAIILFKIRLAAEKEKCEINFSEYLIPIMVSSILEEDSLLKADIIFDNEISSMMHYFSLLLNNIEDSVMNLPGLEDERPLSERLDQKVSSSDKVKHRYKHIFALISSATNLKPEVKISFEPFVEWYMNNNLSSGQFNNWESFVKHLDVLMLNHVDNIKH